MKKITAFLLSATITSYILLLAIILLFSSCKKEIQIHCGKVTYIQEPNVSGINTVNYLVYWKYTISSDTITAIKVISPNDWKIKQYNTGDDICQ